MEELFKPNPAIIQFRLLIDPYRRESLSNNARVQFPSIDEATVNIENPNLFIARVWTCGPSRNWRQYMVQGPDSCSIVTRHVSNTPLPWRRPPRSLRLHRDASNYSRPERSARLRSEPIWSVTMTHHNAETTTYVGAMRWLVRTAAGRRSCWANISSA